MTDESNQSEEEEHMIDVDVVIPQQNSSKSNSKKEELKDDLFRNQIIDIKTDNTPVEEIHDQNEINDNDSDEEEQHNLHDQKSSPNAEQLTSPINEGHNKGRKTRADHNYFGTSPEGEGIN